ncbi:MAG: YwaF family protein [Firmicutes bacterium]|nr:YwaF family protein [Bacillota bacterium]
MLLSTFFTSSGMDSLPTEYLFGWIHFCYLLSAAIVFYLLIRFCSYQNKNIQKIIINVCLILLLVLKYGGELIFVLEWIRYGDGISSYSHPFLDYRTFFSFQMCGVNNVLLPFVIWFNIKPMKDFVFSTSIIGGLAVMIYPAGVLFGDPFVVTFPMLRSLIVHFILVFLPCYMIAIGDFKLDKKRWKYTLVGATLMTSWAMYGNLFVDQSANNMYLMTNPFYGGPVLLLNVIPNGWHVIMLFILVFLGFLLVYFLAGLFNKFYEKHTLTLKKL